MHEYYFKIRKGDIEFECSTSDKIMFEEKLSDWINGIVKGDFVAPPQETVTEENTSQDNGENPQRSGFIDVKNLVSINEISTPMFNAPSVIQTDSETPVVAIDFEQALAESMENPKTEVVEKVESLSDFEAYLNSHNPQNNTDKLIATAKYILNVENQNAFSIKQLNAKLVPLTGEPINHQMIEDAINQNLLRVYPDLTGTSEYTEYTLTEDGEGYFID